MSPATAALAASITASAIWAIRAATRSHHRPADWNADRVYPTDTARKENRP